jgi:cryptochrome
MANVTAVNSSKSYNTIYWFRKCLRLHDNPALLYALENSQILYPIFILDPWFVKSNYKIGPNRWRFLIESLHDLNNTLLRYYNTRLLVIRGQPEDIMKRKFDEWRINMICFELDTEPYAKQRDDQIEAVCAKMGVKVEKRCSHTLYDPDYLYKINGNKVTMTMTSFLSLLNKIGEPEPSMLCPSELNLSFPSLPKDIKDSTNYSVPYLSELGIDESKCGPCLYPGGEIEALKRLEFKLSDEKWVTRFEKPQTSPNSIEPSTTVLSPYLKFGCLSARLFYERLKIIYAKYQKHSNPPVSLEGQLLWREFFYFVGSKTKNFDRIEGNSICHQIKWSDNDDYFQAWKNAKTGYPFIDAVMTQLRTEVIIKIYLFKINSQSKYIT